MLSKRQKKLLTALRTQETWVKSTALASALAVTTRTVRNDVNSINCIHPGLVESSASGYRLALEAKLPSSVFASDKFAGPEERTTFLLSRLLTAHEQVSLYDLADDLYVSYQTIEKDVRNLERELENAGLRLNKRAEMAHVEGPERNRRRMLSQLVYNELNENFHAMTTFLCYFEEVELYRLKTLLQEVLCEKQLSASEYVLNSLALHTAIAIHRIRGNRIIDSGEYTQSSLVGCWEFELAQKIASRIGKEFSLTMPQEEVINLAYHMLGKVKADYSGFSVDTISQVMDESIIALARELLDEVNTAYDLVLYNDSTFVRFLVHIHDMLVRLRNHQSMYNPMKERFKSTYPMIYDIAVFMAGRIHEKLGYEINEDEIAYLAVHIGAGLEHLKALESNEGKVRTLLVCPQYLASVDTIRQALARRVGDDIVITEVHTSVLRDYTEVPTDLIITTVDLSSSAKSDEQQLVMVNPFLKCVDLLRVEDALERLRRERTRREFVKNALSWFREELFFRNPGCGNEWECIDFICERLQQLGYADGHFVKQVCKREKLSSTSYGGGFAIPHSVEMDALGTCISVVLLDKPIPWGEFSASIVFLFAISQDNRKDFLQFYETLAGLFAKPENLVQLTGLRDFHTFIKALSHLI